MINVSGNIQYNLPLMKVTMTDNNKVFYHWSHLRNEELADIKQRPSNVRRKGYLLKKGISCEDWFPEYAEFQLDESSGEMLADVIPNSTLWKIISVPLKELLEKHTSCEMEFLPIRIRDHNGQLIAETYYILNILGSVSCMDRQKSDYDASALDESQVVTFRHLFLDTDKIPENTNLFRFGEERDMFMMRKDLMQILIEAGITGIKFTSIEDIGETYR